MGKKVVDRIDGYHKQNTTDASKPSHHLTPTQNRRATQKYGAELGKAGYGKK